MKIIFAGTPEFAVPSLQKLIDLGHDICAVYTQPDRPAGRGQHLQLSPVKVLALKHKIPVLQPLTLKTDQEFQLFQNFNADLMVVVAYGMMLPQAVLDAPRLGCINGHGSLLPRWRGAAPIQRAIIEGDEETGVTIMQIVKKLDAGDMLHKEIYTIKHTDTSAIVLDELAKLSAIGLQKVLPQIEKGTLHAEPQDERFVTYAIKLSKDETMIDWTQSTDTLVRKIHGLNPWPVAQTIYNGLTMKIWNAEMLDEKTNLNPGQARCTHKNLDVSTGNGFIRIHELQMPNGKRMSATAFLASHNLNGVSLG
ncbi:MAG: methionyl-tRNA formyltransferase [Methylococcales bacterium]|nr:methionyl-tRNA formyltransferase [Methylococcales bacterium]